MGYDLEAVVGSRRAFEPQQTRLAHMKVVSLHQDLVLIPITKELLTELAAKPSISSEKAGSLPDFPDGFRPQKLSAKLVHWLQELSCSAPVMYCEAEYFGGSGGQLAVVWQNRAVVFGPICPRWGQPDQPLNVHLLSDMAINRALKVLGVEASLPSDEFDTVGLSKHRHTEDWS
jgi:hypothetical protein